MNLLEEKGTVDTTITINSLEIAEMLEMRHQKLLEKLEGTKDKKVKGIIPILNEHNFVLVDYFIKDKYIDNKGEERPCYQFTKLGCDFISNKFTGEKGIIFTAKYVKRFYEMENYIKEDKKDKERTIPTTYKEALKQLLIEVEENEKLAIENKEQIEVIKELKVKADYVDLVLQNKSLMTITQIAKDYGMSGEKLNKKLYEMKIQYKQNKQWLLYSNYQNYGYTHSETFETKSNSGKIHIVISTKWTQEGRLFLYETLKKQGILPSIERTKEKKSA